MELEDVSSYLEEQQFTCKDCVRCSICLDRENISDEEKKALQPHGIKVGLGYRHPRDFKSKERFATLSQYSLSQYAYLHGDPSLHQSWTFFYQVICPRDEQVATLNMGIVE